MTSEIRKALVQFKTDHGRMWKSELCKLWESGKDVGPLRLARNAIGPRRLGKIKL